MKKYVISVWNSYATLFLMIETNETLKYEKIDLPVKHCSFCARIFGFSSRSQQKLDLPIKL